MFTPGPTYYDLGGLSAPPSGIYPRDNPKGCPDPRRVPFTLTCDACQWKMTIIIIEHDRRHS